MIQPYVRLQLFGSLGIKVHALDALGRIDFLEIKKQTKPEPVALGRNCLFCKIIIGAEVRVF